MKLGGQMLNIVRISPVILIVGLTVLGQGFKAKVSAEEFLRLVPVEHHERLVHAVRRSVRQTVPLALDVPVSSAGGESMTMRIVAEPLCGVDGRVEKLRGVMCDVTESRRAEADIERLTNVDPLTGLPNRNRFLAQCSEAVSYTHLTLPTSDLV